jgi:hypothetical protein
LRADQEGWVAQAGNPSRRLGRLPEQQIRGPHAPRPQLRNVTTRNSNSTTATAIQMLRLMP